MTVIIDDKAGIEWGDYKIRLTVSSELLSEKRKSDYHCWQRYKKLRILSGHKLLLVDRHSKS